MARGASTRTTRRAPRSPRRGSTRRASRSTRAPRASARRSTSTCSRPTSTPTSSAASSTDNLALARARPARRRTWVLSNHDVVRHATRYGLPAPGARRRRAARADQHGNEWLLPAGPAADLDRRRRTAPRAGRDPVPARRCPARPTSTRARSSACTRSPRSRAAQRQDPTFFRSPGLDVGRDGCRVPLPWTRERPLVRLRRRRRRTCRSRPGSAATPVAAQEGDPGSTLTLYRRALALRHELQTGEELEWIDTGRAGRAALRAPERLGGRHELRRRALRARPHGCRRSPASTRRSGSSPARRPSGSSSR